MESHPIKRYRGTRHSEQGAAAGQIEYRNKRGSRLDKLELPGVAAMVANVLPQGTKNKTPEELEEETELLGSVYLWVQAMKRYLSPQAPCQDFDKTVSLMKEILLEPRWNSSEFVIAQTEQRTPSSRQKLRPRSVAAKQFSKLAYGPDHILGYDIRGTKQSIDKITPDDLKTFYENNFPPSVTTIQMAGNISKEEVLAALKPLEAGMET